MNQCIICYKEFLGNIQLKTCSKICCAVHRKNRRKLLSYKKTCLFCQINFLAKKKNIKFCSRSCGSKFHIKKGTFNKWKLRKNEYRGQVVKCSNINCEQQFYIPPRKINKNNFCSKACKYAWCKIQFSGSGNPMFNKRLSVEQKYRQQQTLFKRYGITNAYTLSKRKAISKLQYEIWEKLIDFFPNLIISQEKLLDKNPEVYADILVQDHNLVIEFNGDYWHCNPKIYDEIYFNKKKNKLAKQIWEEDQKRIERIRKLQYDVIIVWEKDYLLNKESKIQEIVTYLENLNGKKKNNSS